MKGKTDARFTFDRGTWSCDIRLKTYNKIGKSERKKKKRKTTNYPSSSLTHIQQVTCSCHTLFCRSRLCSYSK